MIGSLDMIASPQEQDREPQILCEDHLVPSLPVGLELARLPTPPSP